MSLWKKTGWLTKTQTLGANHVLSTSTGRWNLLEDWWVLPWTQVPEQSSFSLRQNMQDLPRRLKKWLDSLKVHQSDTMVSQRLYLCTKRKHLKTLSRRSDAIPIYFQSKVMTYSPKVVTKVVMPEKIKDLCNQSQIGQIEAFVCNCIQSNKTNLWSPTKKHKHTTWKDMGKKIKLSLETKWKSHKRAYLYSHEWWLYANRDLRSTLKKQLVSMSFFCCTQIVVAAKGQCLPVPWRAAWPFFRNSPLEGLLIFLVEQIHPWLLSHAHGSTVTSQNLQRSSTNESCNCPCNGRFTVDQQTRWTKDLRAFSWPLHHPFCRSKVTVMSFA